MARVDLYGYNDLVKAFSEMINVPDDVLFETLTAMQDVAAKAIRKTGMAYGVYDKNSDVHVLDNVKVNKPRRTRSGGYADITFSGSRERYGTITRNAEIAFINEYGGIHQQGRPFVGEAMETSADAIARAGADVLLDWTEKKFLK